MVRKSWLPLLAVIGTGTLVSACAAGLKTQPPPQILPSKAVAVAHAPVSMAHPPPDPVAQLIADSNTHFASGQQALQVGHLDAARAEFDRAIEVLMQSPYGVDSDSRLRRQFNLLVEQISTEELAALAQGDGFTEKKYEPASIDQLLALSTFKQPAPSAALEKAVSSDLARPHDLKIPLNPAVLSDVEMFSGRLHDWFQQALDRGARYLPMIRKTFQAEGLPLDLAYVPIVESAFKTDALSRASAKGVWQFMSLTGMENGLKRDWYVDQRSDPQKATRAAAKYLKTLAQTFDGNWLLALASYNGGPGRVQRAIRIMHGQRDFWKLERRRWLLPRQTREYVPMILAAIIIGRNPAQYGFTVPAVRPVICDTVQLSEPVDLRRVAQWTGTTVEEIQALNPDLRRWTTPVGVKEYALKVPQGTGDLVRAKLRDALNADIPVASLKWYTVRRGDTLLRIARRLRVRRSDLAEANYLSIWSRLRAGQRLIVPREPSVMLAADQSDESQAAALEAVAAQRKAFQQRVRFVYRVRRGDNLYDIARRFHTSVDELKRWNGLRSSRLSIGRRLTIYRAGRVAARVAARETAETTRRGAVVYRVRRGDTLYGIARRFHTSVEHLKRLNGLRSARLSIGDRLTVEGNDRVAESGGGR